MIVLTPKAQEHVFNLMANEEQPCHLRIEVQGGGCSGMSYNLSFVNKLRITDKIFPQDDFMVLVDPKSFLFLDGLEIDYDNGLNGTGFIYNNPSTTSCGCGVSFRKV